jgi:DNA-binding NarL/FixJ family response regulator
MFSLIAMKEQPMHIILVEECPEDRFVIEQALEMEPGIELVGQYGTSEIALRALENNQPKLSPDLILLDLRLPGMDGLESIPWFQKARPEAKIVILAQPNAESDVLKAIQLGAAGYLLKSSTADQLVDGIRLVIQGRATLDVKITRFILEALQATLPKEAPEALLSKRQMEILALLADGLVKKEIANQLKISFSTVNTHVEHIYQKLEATNAPAAISKAYKKGILPVSEK